MKTIRESPCGLSLCMPQKKEGFTIRIIAFNFTFLIFGTGRELGGYLPTFFLTNVIQL